MPKKTAEHISLELETLATATTEEMQSAGVYVLRDKLANLGVNYVERNGVLVSVNSARKKELLQALETLVNKQRALNMAILPSNTEVVPDVQGIDSESVYNRLIALVDLPHSQAEIYISTLAHEVALAISKAYPDTEDQPRFNTRCNVRSELRKQVLKRVLTSEVSGLRNVFKLWSEQLYAFTQADSNLKRKTNDANTTAKATAHETGDSVEICIQPMLDWATSVLEKASANQLRKTAWKDVAIALGLMTGRRMFGEILYELGTFTATSAMQVTAHELSKNKAEDAPEEEELREMTVLCDSALVVAGKQWLIDNGKVQLATRPATAFTKVDDRMKANQKYASDMSKHWKEVAKGFGIPEGTTTIHSLRKFYVMKAVEIVDGYRSRGVEAARLLGHKNWQTAQDNYNSGYKFVDKPQ